MCSSTRLAVKSAAVIVYSTTTTTTILNLSQITKMKGALIFVLMVVLAVINHVSVEAFKMNHKRQLLLTKVQEVGDWAQRYLDSHKMPYKTTPDYP